MPRRRRYSRARAGAAAGFQSVSQMLAQMMNKNYQQQISQENAAYSRMLQDRGAMLTDTLTRGRDTDKAISENKIDPDQQLGDEPRMPRRVAAVMDPIEKADDPTKLPTVQGLRTSADASRIPLIGFGETDRDAGDDDTLPSRSYGAVNSPEFGQIMGSLTAKQDQFRNAQTPTTRTQIGPAGAKEEFEEQFDPIAGDYRQMAGVRQVERTGAQEGTRGYDEFMSNAGSPARVGREIEIANQTERGTRQERVNTSAATTSATTVAEINARHTNAKKLADIAYQQSVATNQATLEFIPSDTQAREYAAGQQRVNKATNDALRALAQVGALFEAAKSDMPATTGGGAIATAVDQYLPMGRTLLPPTVRRYLEQIDVLRPEIARLNGEVGNLNITEQERAGLVWPTIMDVAQGTADDKLVRFEAFASMSAKIYELTQPGSPMANSPQRSDVIKRMLDVRVMQLKNQPIVQNGITYNIVDVTKDGPVLVPR